MDDLKFTLDQIMESYINYQEICELFFSLATSNEVKLKLNEILYKGKYLDLNISSNLVNKDDPTIEGKRRISYAYLLLQYEETFDKLIENKINLFHGTNSNALSNILKYGLNSGKKSQNIGLDIITGESWSRKEGQRDFVSLTDVFEIAEQYSSLKNQTLENDLSFQVIIGTTIEDVLTLKRRIIDSDIPEIGIKEYVPLENIKVICVPQDKVEFVKKLVNNEYIQVLPIPRIEEKFYFINEYDSKIIINDEKLEKLKNNFQEKNSEKTFTKEEIKNLMVKSKLSNIKKKLSEFYTIINGGKENDGRKIK